MRIKDFCRLITKTPDVYFICKYYHLSYNSPIKVGKPFRVICRQKHFWFMENKMLDLDYTTVRDRETGVLAKIEHIEPYICKACYNPWKSIDLEKCTICGAKNPDFISKKG